MSADPIPFVLLYLDPGSGSLLLQLLVAGLAGAVVFFKYQGRRLLGLFRRSEPEDGSDGD